jgi:hypothetical protein
MPFHKYARYFGPEDLATLEAAFDATWQELSAASIDLSTDEKVASMKQKLAQRILVSATAGGVRDLDTLKEQALRSLGGGFLLRDEQTQAPQAA